MCLLTKEKKSNSIKISVHKINLHCFRIWHMLKKLVFILLHGNWIFFHGFQLWKSQIKHNKWPTDSVSADWSGIPHTHTVFVCFSVRRKSCQNYVRLIYPTLVNHTYYTHTHTHTRKHTKIYCKYTLFQGINWWKGSYKKYMELFHKHTNTPH